jgi:hypothetical protein
VNEQHGEARGALSRRELAGAAQRDEDPGDLRRSDFGQHVRDALAHLYDLPHLQTHPLTQWMPQEQAAGTAAAGLRQTLLDTIEALRPDAGSPASSSAWRSYHVLL